MARSHDGTFPEPPDEPDRRQWSPPDVGMLRSEHIHLRELARVVSTAGADADVGGLVEQLRWMIRDHLRRERQELRSITPLGESVDSWAGLDRLQRVADELGTDALEDARLLDVIEQHCAHLEAQVFPDGPARK